MDRDPLASFAALILTHGRPDNVLTYECIRHAGYTGPIFLLVDDLDPTRERYLSRFGSQVVVFDKRAIAKTFDTADNFADMRSVVYARNACWPVARALGLSHFIQLDDDYTSATYRFDAEGRYIPRRIANLDDVLRALVRFLDVSGADAVALAQGGDFIGGENTPLLASIELWRKAMNSFVCSTDRPFQFLGRINEDVTTYTRGASTGLLFFTTNFANINQAQTQSAPGGMTELYLDSGTYLKTFYSVMFQPSSVSVAGIPSRIQDHRIHHRVAWRNTTPMILRESTKRVA